jgi:hypothetical protein
MPASWRMMTVATLVAAVACVGLVPGVHAQAPNATIGKWKLNVEKSPDLLPTESQIVFRTFEDRGGGLVLATVEGLNQAGEATFSQYAVKHDGQYYPYQTRGAQTANSIAYMPTDNPRHYEWFIKVDGAQGTYGATTVSDDGMTMTILNHPVRDGRRVPAASVFDRLP